MKAEYKRVTEKRAVENGVKFQRKMLVAFVTAIEFLNKDLIRFKIEDGVKVFMKMLTI